MGKNKLRKFAEMKELDCVLEYPFAVLQQQGFPWRGKWQQKFGTQRPIVLELGCGKGEYAVGLAGLEPDKNFIGIDIKGARMYTGAKRAAEHEMDNVAFLRTSIELLPYFFEPGEVDEIWITFPDPQMKKTRKRLTSTRFLELYKQVLKDGGSIHLKTDSPFLYQYTRDMLQASGIAPAYDTSDLYAGSPEGELRPCLPIPNMRTHYEQQWLERGIPIKFISFQLPHDQELHEPESEPEPDSYRSYSRRSPNYPS